MEYKIQIESLKENLKNITNFYSQNEQYFEKQLDYLANIVNKMETEYKRGLPEHLKDVSLASGFAWTSPTLLCLKLKEEYLRIEQDYNNLKSQLSQENSSYLADNNQMKASLLELTQSLQEMTTKW